MLMHMTGDRKAMRNKPHDAFSLLKAYPRRGSNPHFLLVLISSEEMYQEMRMEAPYPLDHAGRGVPLSNCCYRTHVLTQKYPQLAEEDAHQFDQIVA